MSRNRFLTTCSASQFHSSAYTQALSKAWQRSRENINCKLSNRNWRHTRLPSGWPLHQEQGRQCFHRFPELAPPPNPPRPPRWSRFAASRAQLRGSPAMRLALAGRTHWTLHALMYKYLPLAKVQAALCGCQTQQSTNIQGKVFTAALANAAIASDRAARLGPARGRLSPSTWLSATPRLLPCPGNG